jgi:gliding motility-associated-like protein
VSSPSDTTICKGSSIQLAAKGSGGDSTSYFYTWKGIDTTRVITIKPDSSASYQVVLQDFCTVKPDTARMYIRVRIAPSFSPRSDTTICVGQYVVLSMSILNGDTDGASILWKDFPTLKEVVVAPAITTFYEAILTDRCLASPLHDTSVVKVRPSLSLKLSPDTSVCYGNDVRIRAFPSGGLASQYQITWNDKTNGLYYDAKALKLSSNYYAILKDGCTIKPDSAGMKVTVSPELKVEIKDTLVCENTRLTVIPSISGGRKGANYSILWNESQVNNAPSFLIDSAQKVRVRVDDGCSLTAFDTANISVEPLPEVGFSADGNTVVCERKEVRFINESKYAPGSMFYWTLRDKDTAVSSDKFSYAFPDIGSFDIKLKIVSPLGCNDSFTRTGYMQVLPTPIVQFASSNNNINVDEGPLSFRPFTLSDSLTYTWVIEQDTIKSQLLEHHFKNAGVFPVTLIMSNVVGCWDMQTIQVKINDIYSLFVPNAITPNDDGVNDDLIIKGRGIEAFDLKILNRLGEVVFQTNDMNKKWNGKYENGNPAELDTYQCIISTTDAKGKAYLYKGNITVLR